MILAANLQNSLGQNAARDCMFVAEDRTKPAAGIRSSGRRLGSMRQMSQGIFDCVGHYYASPRINGVCRPSPGEVLDLPQGHSFYRRCPLGDGCGTGGEINQFPPMLLRQRLPKSRRVVHELNLAAEGVGVDYKLSTRADNEVGQRFSWIISGEEAFDVLVLPLDKRIGGSEDQ